jgi:hypothetical protein
MCAMCATSATHSSSWCFAEPCQVVGQHYHRQLTSSVVHLFCICAVMSHNRQHNMLCILRRLCSFAGCILTLHLAFLLHRAAVCQHPHHPFIQSHVAFHRRSYSGSPFTANLPLRHTCGAPTSLPWPRQGCWHYPHPDPVYDRRAARTGAVTLCFSCFW